MSEGRPGDVDASGIIYLGPEDDFTDEDDEKRCCTCGSVCDGMFCFCVDACSGCEDSDFGNSEALVPFTFGCVPSAVGPHGEYKECLHPCDCVAFREDNDIVIASRQTDIRYRVVSYELQHRASSQPYFTWYAEELKKIDPADEEYMRSISS